mgnify:FL=1|nr:FecR domain-containing protein [Odoribacter splanchnicus]
MKRRGYDIGRVVDLIFEYWLGRMKDSELEEYRHMKETTGLDKYAREFEDREWIKNALEEPDIFETDKAYRRFWSMTAGKRSIGRLRWRWVASLLIPLLVGGGVGLFVWWQPASIPLSEEIGIVKPKAVVTLANGEKINLGEEVAPIAEKDGTRIQYHDGQLVYSSQSQTAKPQVLYNELTVPRGGEYSLVLGDGTRVWLNAGSKLKYPVRFNGSQRRVFLSGEAYFAVERDTAHPFIVSGSSGEIRVLGTEFNIRDYEDEERVVITLVKGAVSYTGKNLKQGEIVMKPGEQVRAGRRGEKPELLQVNPKEFISWKDGIYFFNKESLEEMMKTVGRNYDVEVFFNGEALKKLRFSGQLKKYERVEEFLQFIETGGDVTFIVKDRTITVNPK